MMITSISTKKTKLVEMYEYVSVLASSVFWEDHIKMTGTAKLFIKTKRSKLYGALLFGAEC